MSRQQSSEDAFVRDAMLWSGAGDDKVRCGLCAHRCLIAPGERGICAVRENRGGVLKTLVFGRAIAAHADPIEKKPLFHFMPGTRTFSIATAGCNFRCSFCQNWSISQASRDRRYPAIPGDELGPEAVTARALEAGCRSIAYTYTEPTIYLEYAYETAVLARERGLANVFVTNGFQTPETIEKMAGLIQAANVDLKSFSDEFYASECGARLQPVLDAVRLMHEAGILVEVTTLIITGRNDSPEELGRIAEFLASISPELPWHVSRFHPDYRMLDILPTPIRSLETALEAGREAGLKHVYLGNAPGVGGEDTVCPQCASVVIRRQGFSILDDELDGDKCSRCGARLNMVADRGEP